MSKRYGVGPRQKTDSVGSFASFWKGWEAMGRFWAKNHSCWFWRTDCWGTRVKTKRPIRRLLRAKLYSPKFIVWNPNHQNVIILKIGSYRVTEIKIKSSGWVLIQYNHCPYKERKLKHRYVHLQREDCVKTITSKPRRGLREKQLCQHLNLRFLASRILIQHISAV